MKSPSDDVVPDQEPTLVAREISWRMQLVRVSLWLGILATSAVFWLTLVFFVIHLIRS